MVQLSPTNTSSLPGQRTILEVFNLHYSIGQKSIVGGLNFHLPSTGITAILGANGSGKSTLLSLVGGFLQPEKGEILFEGTKLIGPDYKLIPGHPEIAFVRQDMRLTPYATVWENLSHILRGHDEESQKTEITKLAKLLGFESYLDKTLKYLSGGEQQRIAIAAALATSPKLLLMDEPFSQTDTNLKNHLKKYLFDIVKELKISILFVTHDPQEALSLADNIFILNEGNILEEGTGKQLYYHPKHILTAELTGYCNWVSQATPSRNTVKVESRTLLRPDRIKIEVKENPGSVKGIIETIEFTGPFNFYRILLVTGEQIMAMQVSNEALQTGQEVYIQY